jgi:cyclophilin family peptidyl-prolyl cis-trans isomerase
MVSIAKTTRKPQLWRRYSPVIGVGVLFVLGIGFHRYLVPDTTGKSLRQAQASQSVAKKTLVLLETDSFNGVQEEAKKKDKCPYMSINDLSKEERNPKRGRRHMVSPPEGGLLHLVCCQTTKGPLNALVHEKWAANGAKRFLEVVQSGYFSSGVPMMRCIKGFLCQFGLNNDPVRSKQFKETLPDDPNWLPEGKEHRTNEKGVKRFPRGYLAYAGGGINTRDIQFIVSLVDVETLAGGSPWEVPWGELVGKHSFDTLSRIYTGYGEDGPPQGTLWAEGMTKISRAKFPKLDYITSCSVVDQQIQV